MTARDLTAELRRRIAPALTQRVADEHVDRALDEAAGAAVFRLASLGVVEGLELPPELAPAPLTIIDGRELGCWWEPGHRDARPRPEPPRSVVIHWTGGPTTRTAQRVCATLRARELSIGYVVEGDGDVVQCADDMTITEHAGAANPWSIGIECAHPGYDKTAPRVPFLGHRYRMAPWPEAQLRSLVALVELLCERHSIPRRIPPETRGLAPDWRGVFGHYHVHSTKTDPGPHPFAALVAAGFEQA